MSSFATRMGRASRTSRIILAADYSPGTRNVVARVLETIRDLHEYVCAIKLNMHLLLPLGTAEIRRITKAAHRRNLECIADIKLNDIPDTNAAAASHLWRMGIDAIIANPMMGPGALGDLVRLAHDSDHGIISLCHMSAPSARVAYDQRTGRTGRLYRLFLKWAVSAGTDGIIVGATYPDIVRYCRRISGAPPIYSPGIGAQGGDARAAIDAGSSYLIVGRSIISARDPLLAARDIISGLSKKSP